MRLSFLLASVALAASIASSFTAPATAQNPPRPAGPRPVLTRAPRLTHFVEAPWPPGEKADKASVLLQIAISAAGKVELVSVQQSAGSAFDEAAIKAAQQFVFEPAELDGKPAPVRITYRYEFVLKEAPKKTTADYSGVVVDRKTGRRLAGVTVKLDSGQRAVTDAAGKFKIEGISPGKHQVMLSGAELGMIGTEESFEPARRSMPPTRSTTTSAAEVRGRR